MTRNQNKSKVGNMVTGTKVNLSVHNLSFFIKRFLMKHETPENPLEYKTSAVNVRIGVVTSKLHDINDYEFLSELKACIDNEASFEFITNKILKYA